MLWASYYLTNDKGNYYSGISIIFFNFCGKAKLGDFGRREFQALYPNKILSNLCFRIRKISKKRGKTTPVAQIAKVEIAKMPSPSIELIMANMDFAPPMKVVCSK